MLSSECCLLALVMVLVQTGLCLVVLGLAWLGLACYRRTSVRSQYLKFFYWKYPWVVAPLLKFASLVFAGGAGVHFHEACLSCNVFQHTFAAVQGTKQCRHKPCDTNITHLYFQQMCACVRAGGRARGRERVRSYQTANWAKVWLLMSAD